MAGTFEYDFIGSIIGASSTGNSPVNGAIAASVSGTAASGVNSVTAGGTSNGSASFTNVTQSLTNGNGSGAQFSISTDGAGNYSFGGVTTAGNGYQVGDSITINGASLGGVNGINNLTLTVTTLTSANFSVAQSSTTGSGSGAIFNLTSDANGNCSIRYFNIWKNYALNDRVTIVGSSRGTDTQNDATLTLTSVGATTINNLTQTSTTELAAALTTIAIDGAGNYSELTDASH